MDRPTPSDAGDTPRPASTETGDDVAAPVQTLRVEISSLTIWQVIGAILVTLVALELASRASGLLGLIALSFFFSLALEPAVRRLHGRYGWRRGACVGVVYAAGLAFLLFLILILVPAIGELAARVAENGSEWLANLSTWAQETLGVPIDLGDAGDASDAGAAIERFGAGGIAAALDIAGAGVGMIFSIATIAMFTFYLTADAGKVQRSVLKMFSPTAQERVGWAWDQAIVQTGGYFYSRMLLMVINSIGFFATMAIVGVPFGLALSLAVFGGFVSVFIPAVGTYIGGAVPVLITLAIAGLVPALVVLGYILIYQQIENYWLSPKISANTMTLNGGVAFAAALAGGAIAGPMGAFVALPVAALITSMIRNFGRSYDIVYASSFAEDDEAEATPPTGQGADASTELPPDRRR